MQVLLQEGRQDAVHLHWPFQHHHMPSPGNHGQRGSGNMLLQEVRIFHWGQAIVFAANHLCRHLDSSDFLHDIKGVTGQEIPLESLDPVPGECFCPLRHSRGEDSFGVRPPADELSSPLHVTVPDGGQDVRMNAKPRARANQYERYQSVRIRERNFLDNTPTHGVTDKNRAKNPQGIQQVPKKVSILFDRSVTGPLAFSVAWKIHGQCIPARPEMAQLETPLFLRPACAVDKDHRWPTSGGEWRPHTIMDS